MSSHPAVQLYFLVALAVMVTLVTLLCQEAMPGKRGNRLAMTRKRRVIYYSTMEGYTERLYRSKRIGDSGYLWTPSLDYATPFHPYNFWAWLMAQNEASGKGRTAYRMEVSV